MTLPVATESQLQVQIAQYLCTKHPGVEFHSDFGSGAVLSARQAAIQLRQNGYRRGYPDLLVAVPKIKRVRVAENAFQEILVGGLFLELKREKAKLYKKNGAFASRHIAEQADFLQRLRSWGYVAEFAVGYDDAVEKIEKYLGLDGANLGLPQEFVEEGVRL